jgi:hypothetical protein
MVSMNTNIEDSASGTGAKAAQYLKRMSADSSKPDDGAEVEKDKDSESGFGDSSDDERPAKAAGGGGGGGGDGDSDSGFSDVSSKAERKSVASKGSAKTQDAEPSGKYSSEGGSASGSAPDRQNRRAATLSEAKNNEDKESGFGSSSEEDKDLLSNPFASDSEEEK